MSMTSIETQLDSLNIGSHQFYSSQISCKKRELECRVPKSASPKLCVSGSCISAVVGLTQADGWTGMYVHT